MVLLLILNISLYTNQENKYYKFSNGRYTEIHNNVHHVDLVAFRCCGNNISMVYLIYLKIHISVLTPYCGIQELCFDKAICVHLIFNGWPLATHLTFQNPRCPPRWPPHRAKIDFQHNFGHICTRKLILTSIIMFLGSRNPKMRLIL